MARKELNAQPKVRNAAEYYSRQPKISVVTAVYNGEEFLERTILSVIHQGYRKLEYVIVNDGSTDRTAKIIEKYEPHFAAVVHQPNRGLYAALNAGFAKTTGEVMGWLNSSDILQPGGLEVVGTVFGDLPGVDWITGRPTGLSTAGMATHFDGLMRWSRFRFLAGANRYIQQESTYWRRSLWEKAGARMDESFHAEGDFDLWVRFFRHAELYTVDALIGAYRFHEDALSFARRTEYDRTCDEVVAREVAALQGATPLRAIRRLTGIANRAPLLRRAWKRTAMQWLYAMPGPDWAPVLEYTADGWRPKS